MKWEDFIHVVGDLPVIESEILLAGMSNPAAVRVQISRWEKMGRLIQLKRGIYLLNENYRKVAVYEPYIASILVRPSYISLEKALEFYGLIPEAVPVYTSVTTKRPGRIDSKIGVFDYRHIKNSFFWGYKSVSVNKQTAFIAFPEKALLDLVYIKEVKISAEYLNELRLQSAEKINPNRLSEYAERFNKPCILYAAKVIKEYIDSLSSEEKIL